MLEKSLFQSVKFSDQILSVFKQDLIDLENIVVFLFYILRVAKDKIKLPDGFDEAFDSLDSEVADLFNGE